MKKLQKIDYLNILFWSSVAVGLIGGLFYDIIYGFIACGIISIIMSYTIYSYSDTIDILGVGFISFLMFGLFYIIIIFSTASIIDTKEKIISESVYNIRLLENETIVYQTHNKIETKRDSGLYYKCKLENCTNLVEIIYTRVPTNTLWAEDIFIGSKVKYTTK